MALNSFFTGLAGLQAQSSAINVIGDNLANVNTTAFKGSTVRFADLVAGGVTSASGNPAQEGLGANVASITPSFRQGTLQTTGGELDLALDGDGFFVAQSGLESVYTRAGNFQRDRDGFLITANGSFVQGWTATGSDGSIESSGPVSPLKLSSDLTGPLQATTELQLSLNLDARSPDTTEFSTTIEIFDSLGAPHILNAVFTKTSTLQWDYDITIDGGETDIGTPGTPVSLVSSAGTLEFGPDGVLDALTGVDGAPPADIALALPATHQLANGASPLVINWDMVDALGAGRVQSIAADSAMNATDQDGFPSGNLESLQLDREGVVLGRFSNGRTQSLARIAVAIFPNSAGLNRLSGNEFGTSGTSGQAALGAAGSGSRGNIIGGALEQSNVDIAEQFTSLILAQRGYQANSRIITTSDEVTQEAINLKR